jgi:hypothetical protein
LYIYNRRKRETINQEDKMNYQIKGNCKDGFFVEFTNNHISRNFEKYITAYKYAAVYLAATIN